MSLNDLRRWSRRSLANSFTLRAATIAIGSALLVAVISLVVIYGVERSALNGHLQARAERFAERIERTLGVVEAGAASLAKSGILAAALRDVPRRDAYVRPFFENFSFPVDAANGLALCDTNGGRLAGTRSILSDCRADSPLFRQVLESGKSFRELATLAGGDLVWIIYHAVTVSQTGGVDGVVVTQLNLNDVLRPVPADLELEAVMLVRAGGSEGLAAAGRAGEDMRSARAPLFRHAGDVAPFAMDAVAYESTTPLDHRLLQLLLASYALGALLLVLGVGYMARQVSRQVTGPLSDLTEVATRIAKTGDTSVQVPVTDQGEAGHLGRAIQRMLETIHGAETRLENEVDARTRELQASEASLREREVQLTGILESTADGILAIASGGRVLRANQRFIEMWRIPRALLGARDDQAMLRHAIDQLCDPEAFRSKVKALNESGATDTDVLHFRDGRVFDRNSAPLVLNGTVLGRVWSFHDITERTQADEALRASRERFEQLTELTSDWYWEQDEQFRFVSMAGDVHFKTGIPVEEQIGRARWDLPTINVRKKDWAQHRALLERHEPFYHLELGRIGPDGRVRWMSISGRPHFADDGTFKGYRGVGQDITQRKLAEEALRGSEEKFAKAFRASPEFMAISTVSDGRYIDVNEAYERVTGFARSEVIGRTAVEIGLWVNAQDRARMVELIRRDGRVRDFEVQFRKKSGEIMNCQSSSETLTIDGVPCILSVTQDVTSRRRADQEIRKLAHYDTLTGLSNRTFFLEQLQHAVALAGRNGTMLALLFIDLDHFKDVNDRLGHAAGDAVLAQLGVRMVQSLRQSDIAGRIGGDEFVVLLEACADRKDVDEVANKLMNAIVQPMRIRDETCRLTASMGVACLPENGLDADTLLKHADTAMYRAKRHGRNGICFYSDAEGAGDA